MPSGEPGGDPGVPQAAETAGAARPGSPAASPAQFPAESTDSPAPAPFPVPTVAPFPAPAPAQFPAASPVQFLVPAPPPFPDTVAPLPPPSPGNLAPLPPMAPSAARGPGGWFGSRARLGRRGWTIAAAGVAVVALVAGLIVWSPWTPSPPSAVRVAGSTASTVEITWTASGGIASPDHYLVLRDGQQVGSVPASETSFTDQDLTPGTTYDYVVVAAGLVQSGHSAVVSVTTPAPSPVGLTVTRITHSTVALHWSPPGNAPVPDLYKIYNGPEQIDTIEGTVTTYTDTHQQPGSTFQYAVVAQWGNHTSKPSASAAGETLNLPVTGAAPVHVVTTTVPGNGFALSVGYHWDDVWGFSGTCSGDSCSISADVGIRWYQQYQSNPYTVTLRGSGGTYSGTAPVPVAEEPKCGGSVTTSDTVTLTITAKGPVVKGTWQAWTGTMVYNEALALASNGGYCPAATWRFAVTTTS